MSAEDFIGLQFTITLLLPLLLYTAFKSPLFSSIGAGVGLIFPYYWLWDKMNTRQKAIRSTIPDILDTLSLAVAAGLDFNAAIRKICDIYADDGNPFTEELHLMLQNITLGRSREEALREMAARIDMTPVYSFVSILIQAEKMGSSIADTLKSQAERYREDRFLEAERAGAVAAQKLLVPMIIFIFPLLFVVIFGPCVLQFIYR